MERDDELLDCLIVGGGPAGLTAALYLARFRRNVRVIDAGNSRAAMIPVSHNYPGFPDGINGIEFLRRLHAQASHYCRHIDSGIVQRLERQADGGFAASGAALCQARCVILATGMLDIEPDLPNLKNAVRQGYIRHCPICDGYEVIDRKVAVIGHGKDGLREALFLRHFTSDLTLLTLGKAMDLSDDERALLRDAGIQVTEEPIAEVAVDGGQIAALTFASGKAQHFDTLYSALGATM